MHASLKTHKISCQILFEELRCENFYEKGLVEQRGKADDEYAITTPKLNASTSSSSASETTKRRSGERAGHGHPPTKQQRLTAILMEFVDVFPRI